MKFKTRKIKSWLRWAKKRYKEKYNIQVIKIVFTKQQLKVIQEINNERRKVK